MLFIYAKFAYLIVFTVEKPFDEYPTVFIKQKNRLCFDKAEK